MILRPIFEAHTRVSQRVATIQPQCRHGFHTACGSRLIQYFVNVGDVPVEDDSDEDSPPRPGALRCPYCRTLEQRATESAFERNRSQSPGSNRYEATAVMRQL